MLILKYLDKHSTASGEEEAASLSLSIRGFFRMDLLLADLMLMHSKVRSWMEKNGSARNDSASLSAASLESQSK